MILFILIAIYAITSKAIQIYAKMLGKEMILLWKSGFTEVGQRTWDVRLGN
jgi:hypothetical protein